MSIQPQTTVGTQPTKTVGGVSTIRDIRERQLLEKRIEQHFKPSWYKRVISWMKPDLALGVSIGPDASQSINRIMIILFGSLLMGIISTLAWYYVEGDKVNEQILVAVFSISWFIFVSFLFLLFERTRLLHILSFLTLLLLCGYVQDDYAKKKKSETTGGKLLLATTLIAAIVGFLLLMSFATSRKEEELYQMKSEIQSLKQQKATMKVMQDHVKEQIIKERMELEEELKGKDVTVRKKIADAFIEDVMVRAAAGKLQGGGGGSQSKKKAETNKEEDKT